MRGLILVDSCQPEVPCQFTPLGGRDGTLSISFLALLTGLELNFLVGLINQQHFHSISHIAPGL